MLFKWYIEGRSDNADNLARTSYAIVDSEGYIVMGMTHISKRAVNYIVKLHNDSVERVNVGSE